MQFIQRLLIVSCALSLVICCAADVAASGNSRYNARQNFARQQRIQRLEAVEPTPYPENGFRPQRPFGLPTDQATVNSFNFPPLNAQSPAFNPAFFSSNNNDNFENNNGNNFAATPDALYGAPVAEPARQRQLQPARLQQQAPVQFTRSRLPAARLTDEREEREFLQENPSDIEVDVKQAAETIPVNQPSAAAAPPMSTIAYFPAGAVGFVKPFPTTFNGPAFAAPAVAAPAVAARNIAAPAYNIGEVPLAKVVAQPAQYPVLQYQNSVESARLAKAQFPVLQYQNNVESTPFAKVVAQPAQFPVLQYQNSVESVGPFAKYITSDAQLPFSAQYYTTSSYVPQTLSYAAPAAQLQAW